MAQFNVKCIGSENLQNLSAGIGELRIDNPYQSESANGAIIFDKAPIRAGEVFERASTLAVYCHAPYPLSLGLGNIQGASYDGPEWKITDDGVYHRDGRLYLSLIHI